MSQQALLDTLVIDTRRREPQYRQLHRQLRQLLLGRGLRPGTRLPSTRSLSSDLGVARNTVVCVYEQLSGEGLIETARGKRAWVADLPAPASLGMQTPQKPLSEDFSRRGRTLVRQRHSSTPRQSMDLQPGMPDMQQFPLATWRRLLSARMKLAADELFGYHSFAGHRGLREAISSYVATSRGVRCSADQVIVTSGAQAALNFLASVFTDPGDEVLLEEPGYTGAQGAFLAGGAKLLPLQVREDGWDLEQSRGTRPRLIFLTPSCQFPIGITMRMEQRLKLLEFAHKTAAWVIEDDFDSEYRFSTRPIPAMQGVDDTDRTLYVGTFAKTLFPSLRIGFLVVPGAIGERMAKALFLLGHTAPLFLQATLADFIYRGEFAKHLRRMRRLYGRRRARFIRLVPEYLGRWLEPMAGGTGLQTAWRLCDGIDDAVIARAAREKSLNPTPLSTHYHHGSPVHGLILGYAAADEKRTHLALARLRSVFEHESAPGRRS